MRELTRPTGLLHLVLGICGAGACVPLALANVRLPAVFSDHMVLLAQAPAPIWGWAEPGEDVTVTIAGRVLRTKASSQGKWQVVFHQLATSADPVTLSVVAANTIMVHDVLIGEVWLGSGQSNMAMIVAQAQDYAREQAAANYPAIRVFTERSGPSTTMQEAGSGTWVVCSPATVGGFSATLFYFGREIHRALRVPLGLINSSVGGSPIEAWIAREAQEASAELKPFMSLVERERLAAEAAQVKFERALAVWQHETETPGAKKRPAQPRPPALVRQARHAAPGCLFNAKIAPLIPYAIRGALWYQGEANTAPEKAPYYRRQLTLLVQDWRARWGHEFPFAWAQLPNYAGPGRDWPTVREAMRQALALPQTGMGINIDIGNPNNVHPANKQEVGRRLSLWALGSVYHREVVATSGPLPLSHEIRGGEVIVTFAHADGGLVARGGELTGFLIAGEDRQWRPARARTQGAIVMLTHPDVVHPVAMRYAWENDPVCNLYNGAGLPASPFRTDTW